MTLPEKIIFLADYIEDGRKYDSCRALRESFMRELSEVCEADASVAAAPENTASPTARRLACLDRAVLAELRGTLRSLAERSLPVNADTLRAEAFVSAELGE